MNARASCLPFVLALCCLAPAATAHEDVTPPRLIEAPAAEWPAGRALPNDLIVPVLLELDEAGRVARAELEAGVGEPFDTAALAAARRFRFEPARDAAGPRRARVRAIVRFQAADAIQEPAEAAAGEPEVEAPREVIVHGKPAPRSASEVVVERQLLELAPHRNASELLLELPGMFVTQHSGDGKAHQIFFRGFDAVHGQDVEIWVAGAPVNDVSNIHGQGYADLFFVMPEVVERIQSSPGPYDPRQGDFAVAGTLRFGLGYDEPGVTAKASLGSFGTRRYFMAYRPRTAPSATFGAFELYASDGFGPSRAARRGSALAQLEHELGAGVRARVMASSYAGRFDSAGVLRLADVESGAVDRFATYDPKQGGYSSRTQLVLELGSEHDADADAERWSISPFLVLRSLELRSNFTGFQTSPEGDSIEQTNQATSVGATAAYRRRVELFSPRDALEAGVFLRTDAIDQSQHRLSLQNDRITDDADSPGIDAEIQATNAAAYLDGALQPWPRVALRGGLRADALSYRVADARGASGRVRSSLGAQLSKRGVLDVLVARGLHALGSYGEGFRSPQARSLGHGETTPFTRVRSAEVGLSYHAPELRASLAAYRTWLSDDLVFDHATARSELVPGTSRTGVTLDVVAEPKPWFSSSTSVTYTRARFEDSGGRYAEGDLVPYVPELVVRADMAARPVLGRLGGQTLRGHAGTGLSFLGRRQLPFSERGHDVLLLDLKLELRLGAVATGLDVFNALDAEWYDGEFVYASQFGAQPSLVPARHVTVGAPRTVLWSLSAYL